MQGHAAANMVPVVASNRWGKERSLHYTREESEIAFYGESFICDEVGEIVAECEVENGYAVQRRHTFDLDAIAKKRASWGLFRDRRPDLYKSLLSLDGK